MRASAYLLSRGLRPFPLQLSVGNDIVKVSRVSRLLFGDGSDIAQHKFLQRLFTQSELLQLEARFPKLRDAQSDIAQREMISQHVAGRFAAKEAVIKACTWRRLLLRDVELHQRTEASGVYGIILDPSTNDDSAKANTTTEALQTGANDPTWTANGQVVQVSISHEDDYATAVCIAATEPAAGDVGGEAAARQP